MEFDMKLFETFLSLKKLNNIYRAVHEKTKVGMFMMKMIICKNSILNSYFGYKTNNEKSRHSSQLKINYSKLFVFKIKINEHSKDKMYYN